MQSENGVLFKAFLGDEIRRFTIDKNVVTNFEYLKAKLVNVFPNIGKNQFAIKWNDDDGDKVTISSDEDLIVALSSIPENLKKIYIIPNKTNQSQDKDDDDDDEGDVLIDINLDELLSKPPQMWAEFCRNSPHPGVMCDGCNGPIVGFRYKCVSCEDFDLCGTCEGNFIHAHHVFMRFPWPMGRMAHKVTRKAGRMFRGMKKDRPFGDDMQGCPRKFRREESVDSGDARKRSIFLMKPMRMSGRCEGKFGRHGHGKNGDQEGHHGGGHHGGGHHGGGHHGGGHHGGGHHGGKSRPCGNRETWFQTFNKFLNEVTNLAGDTYESANTAAASAATAAGSASAAASAARASASATPMDTEGANQTQNQNGNLPKINIPHAEINAKIVENIGATITNILKPFGMEFNMELKPTTATQNNDTNNPTPSGNNNNNSNFNNNNNNNINNMNLAEQVPTPQPSTSYSVNDLMNASTESNKNEKKPDESPTRDTWTIINSEEHFEDATAPLITKPVGFDMEKISKDFHRHVGFTVSPPEVNTAVPVPPVGVDNIYPNLAQDASSFFSTQNPSQAASAEPEYRPSNPRVAKALEKMLAMGFKNEGGHLARLLEAKDGNIEALFLELFN